MCLCCPRERLVGSLLVDKDEICHAELAPGDRVGQYLGEPLSIHQGDYEVERHTLGFQKSCYGTGVGDARSLT